MFFASGGSYSCKGLTGSLDIHEKLWTSFGVIKSQRLRTLFPFPFAPAVQTDICFAVRQLRKKKFRVFAHMCLKITPVIWLLGDNLSSQSCKPIADHKKSHQKCLDPTLAAAPGTGRLRPPPRLGCQGSPAQTGGSASPPQAELSSGYRDVNSLNEQTKDLKPSPRHFGAQSLAG